MRWLVFVAMAACSAAHAADQKAARDIAASCASCHATNGVSERAVQGLAGRSKDDIVRAMHEFKEGTKPGTIMPQLAKGYTDTQIELAAEWFATQKAGK